MLDILKNKMRIPIFSRWSFVFSVCLITFQAGADAGLYLKTRTKAGDGTLSLLRRYQLAQYPCNIEHFYQLNGLRQNAPLYADREYTLPIRLVPFDGRTIRSSVGISNYDLALQIQQYNEKMVEAGICPAHFKSSKVLWVPHHFLNCPEAPKILLSGTTEFSQDDPENAGGARNYPIFGPAYAKVPLESQRLKNKVFYLIAGHGGPDPGAIANRGGKRLCEDEYAYDVTLRLCRNLIAHGAIAYMITRDLNDGIRDDHILSCDTDEVTWGNYKIPDGQIERLTQRIDIVNALFESHRAKGVQEQMLIEIHVDSRSHNQRTDVYFYHHSASSDGKAVADNLQMTLREKYKQFRKSNNYTGTATARDLFTLRSAKPVSVYVELANIRNLTDQQRLILPRNRQILAEWLFEGLLK